MNQFCGENALAALKDYEHYYPLEAVLSPCI
jgi:hypothetical protein